MQIRTALLIKTFAILFAIGCVTLPANESYAQLSVELKGKVGMASSTIDDTSGGDPIFDIGGGGQAAVMLRFAAGIQAGLNFNFNAESHVTQGAANPRPVIRFFVPSVGVKAGFDLMPSVNAGAWANFAFGSADNDLSDVDATFGLQGFEIGAEINLNYQLKPYRTYIVAGLYGYFQYLQMFLDNPGQHNGVQVYSQDFAAQNIGLGVNLGVRFDFSL